MTYSNNKAKNNNLKKYGEKIDHLNQPTLHPVLIRPLSFPLIFSEGSAVFMASLLCDRPLRSDINADKTALMHMLVCAVIVRIGVINVS